MTRSLLLLRLILGCFQSCTTASNVQEAAECCLKFHKNPIPLNKIKTIEELRFDCPVPGVILTTERGLRVCADPEVPWVRRAIEAWIKQDEDGPKETPKQVPSGEARVGSTTQQVHLKPTTSVQKLNPRATSVQKLNPRATSVQKLNPRATSVQKLNPSATSVQKLNPSATSVQKLNPSATRVQKLNPRATSVPHASTRQPSTLYCL